MGGLRSFACAAALLASPSLASASDDAIAAVKFFYDNAGYELGPLFRDRFGGAARAQLDAGDLAPEGTICFDYLLSSGGPRQSDEARVADEEAIGRFEDDLMRTISYEAKMRDADTGDIVVRFVALGESMTVVWSLVGDADRWYIHDISSPDNGWRFSEQSCPY